MSRPLSRRGFLTHMAVLAPISVLASARLAATLPDDRLLRFAHTHTGERLTVEYFQRGEYVEDGLVAVRRLLRDFRTGDTHEIDRGLLDLLFALGRQSDSSHPFHVISGYRSPSTNALLRKQSEGVAAGSLHMEGRAIDIRLPEVPLAALRRSALALRAGGVGYYPASDFIHVDVGRVRQW